MAVKIIKNNQMLNYYLTVEQKEKLCSQCLCANEKEHHGFQYKGYLLKNFIPYDKKK
jgi:hypothetical protein